MFLECLSSRSLEWNAPIWFAGLDLTKAFDRIEYNPLYDVLLRQGVPRRYSTLLWQVYLGQTVFFSPAPFCMGVKGSTLSAGVKQPDVISPVLFNAGLGHAMQNGKPSCFIMGCSLGMVAG